MMLTNKQAEQMIDREWNAALDLAASLVIEATGIPIGARNPTRDRLVIEGERIAEHIRARKRACPTGYSSEAK